MQIENLIRQDVVEVHRAWDEIFAKMPNAGVCGERIKGIEKLFFQFQTPTPRACAFGQFMDDFVLVLLSNRGKDVGHFYPAIATDFS